MGVRLLVSRLASAQTRGSAARGLATLCAFGFVLTLIVLAARGALERWFFVLLVWALLVYVPLRIALEAAGTLAPALRRRLAGEAARDAARFSTVAGTELTVDRLFERDVVMPRIATPLQREKARDGALAVLLAVRRNNSGLAAPAAAALGCLGRWVVEIGPWAQREAGQNIQIRWREVRALAAMAAMTKVLVAVDAAGDTAEFLDACLDYCDDLALEVEVRLWDGPSPDVPIDAAHAAAIRDAWRTYTETGAPALDSRKAFVDLLLGPSPARTP